MGNIYHVSKSGRDANRGTEDAPFFTIQKAADVAAAGDTVIVHGGVYREWVKPQNGGLNENSRITYMAAAGERPVIKGSERITGWQRMSPQVWRVSLPEAFFQGGNPFRTVLDGDWFVSPRERRVHCGDVYLNGRSLYEAFSAEEVMNPRMRTVSPHETWGNREERIGRPEETLFQWYAEVEEDSTTLFANFQELDPNRECVEVSVRKACFWPERTGLNYITVRGFEMAQAATQWAPPTAPQQGLIGPNWSKGWIIEDNIIHDSKCCGISLGKEAVSGDNEFTRFGRKPGYQYQLEAVFKGRGIGWSRERVGSHLIRNNHIYDCGQAGIVGHMGCIFSRIYGNEIDHIGTKHEFYGHEIAGIKLHAAVDTVISHNYIHHCSLGTWLDWQAQGTRISCSLYDKNNRDLMIEVTHGPYLVDNNIFTAKYTFDNAAQGGAYAHNLCCGFMNHYPILNRATPYHFPHSTEIMGTAPVYGSDDRWYQNIFVGGKEPGRVYGTASYNGAPVSMEEYTGWVRKLGYGDVEQFERVKQPAYIDGNVYLGGAEHFEREQNFLMDERDAEVRIDDGEEEICLEITLPGGVADIPGRTITSELLGMPRITECRFEQPDGTGLSIDTDMLGQPRGEHPAPGPIQGLKPGKNRIKLWRRGGETYGGRKRK